MGQILSFTGSSPTTEQGLHASSRLLQPCKTVPQAAPDGWRTPWRFYHQVMNHILPQGFASSTNENVLEGATEPNPTGAIGEESVDHPFSGG